MRIRAGMAATKGPYFEVDQELQFRPWNTSSEELAEIRVRLKPMGKVTRYSVEEILEHLTNRLEKAKCRIRRSSSIPQFHAICPRFNVIFAYRTMAETLNLYLYTDESNYVDEEIVIETLGVDLADIDDMVADALLSIMGQPSNLTEMAKLASSITALLAKQANMMFYVAKISLPFKEKVVERLKQMEENTQGADYSSHNNRIFIACYSEGILQQLAQELEKEYTSMLQRFLKLP